MKIPISFDRVDAARFKSAVVEGQAVKLSSGTDYTEVDTVTAATDYVVGFAKDMDRSAGQDGDIYREGGSAYALAAATALAKGARVKIDASGKLVAAGNSEAAIGYTLAAIAANEIGAIYFQRGS